MGHPRPAPPGWRRSERSGTRRTCAGCGAVGAEGGAMKRWRMVMAAAALAATLGMPGLARAEEYPESAGWGVLAVFANVVYMPVKTVYAVVGGLTGGFAYVCTGGSYDTAKSVWAMSMGGTYVLTPGMIRGDDPIY